MFRSNMKLLCPGIDPDMKKIPASLTRQLGDKAAMYQFLKEYVILSATFAGAYKLQKAFFDALPEGRHLLAFTVECIRAYAKTAFIILDCKIGDTPNTMMAYLEYMACKLQVDAVVVNPFVGTEVLDAFNGYPSLTPVVLCKTSNPGSFHTQDVPLKSGRPYWEYLLQMVIAEYPRAIPILPCSSTLPRDIRKKIPDARTVFVAGYGSQGGTLAEVNKLRNKQGDGILVGSSRGLLYPYPVESSDWCFHVKAALEKMEHELNGH